VINNFKVLNFKKKKKGENSIVLGRPDWNTFEPLHTECRKQNEWLRWTEVVLLSRLPLPEATKLASSKISSNRLVGMDW
jgi:hypothetical protein